MTTTNPSEPTSSDASTAALYVDEEGREWTTRKVTLVDVPGYGGGGAEGPTQAEVDAMTDEEYANRLRAVRLVGDVEYTRTTVDVAAVKAARAKDKAGVRMRTTLSEPGVALPIANALSEATTLTTESRDPSLWFFAQPRIGLIGAAESRPDPLGPFLLSPVKTGVMGDLASIPEMQNPRSVFYWPNDDRYFVQHSQAQLWPNKMNMVLQRTGGSCSATLIGRWTAISAAHCFFDFVHQVWLSTSRWKLGVVTTYNTLDFSVTQTAWPGYETDRTCYAVTIPAAYMTTGDWSQDFAVLDFKSACGGLEPGSSAGYHLAAIGNYSDYYNAEATMQAYDGNVEEGWPSSASQGLNRPLFPTLLTRNGAATSCWVAEDWRLRCYGAIDTTSGASGGGLLQQLFVGQGDLFWYWVGNHNHHATASQWSNGFRRLTWGSWGFIGDNTSEW